MDIIPHKNTVRWHLSQRFPVLARWEPEKQQRNRIYVPAKYRSIATRHLNFMFRQLPGDVEAIDNADDQQANTGDKLHPQQSAFIELGFAA